MLLSIWIQLLNLVFFHADVMRVIIWIIKQISYQKPCTYIHVFIYIYMFSAIAINQVVGNCIWLKFVNPNCGADIGLFAPKEDITMATHTSWFLVSPNHRTTIVQNMSNKRFLYFPSEACIYLCHLSVEKCKCFLCSQKWFRHSFKLWVA